MVPEFTIVPARKIDKLIERPHKPVSFQSEREKAEFADLIWRMQREMVDSIERLGYMSNLGKPIDAESDFYVNQDVGLFRMLGFEMKSRRMISRELLLILCRFLEERAPDYAIFISNEFDDEDLELFLLYVTRTTIYGAFEVPGTAEKFGFDVTKGRIGPIA